MITDPPWLGRCVEKCRRSARIRHSALTMAAAVVAGVSVAASPAGAQTQATGALTPLSCGSLGQFQLRGGTVTGAESVPAGTYTAVDGEVFTQLPAFCRAAVTLSPAIHLEVWMPSSTWNGRFEGVGNGAFAGVISYSAMASALRSGFATASTDTGHTAADTANTWISNPAQLEEYGHTSIHLMTVAAKDIAKDFYGQSVSYSYFVGGSTGGDQAMEEAEFFPADYDGIVAESPGLDFSHLMMSFIWNALPLARNPSAAIPPSQLAVLYDAVLKACGTRAGVSSDPFLDDPQDCNFDPHSIECKTAAASNCLTAQQVATAENVYGPVTNPRTGQLMYPGFARGSEADPFYGQEPTKTGWYYAAGSTYLAAAGAQPLIGRAVFNDPSWNWESFDFDRDARLVDQKLSPHVDATDPDLSAFKADSGKLIMTQGWGDYYNAQALPIEYYDSVVLTMGGLPATQSFFRLFMAPGMGHVGGGPGPNTFDYLSAIQGWVEHGAAPAGMVATKYLDDEPSMGAVMSRPLCAYPDTARYTGSGSTASASNFRCAMDQSDYSRDLEQERKNMLADIDSGDLANLPN